MVISTMVAAGSLIKLGHELYRLNVGDKSAEADQSLRQKQALGILPPAGTLQHNPPSSGSTPAPTR